MSSPFNSLWRYWGKAAVDKDGGVVSYHLLVFHCLDVAAVAAYWWDSAPALRRLMCGKHDSKSYRAWLLFFVALHDLGKWDIRFQAKCWLAWQALNREDASRVAPRSRPWNHGLGGLYWLRQDRRNEAEPAMPGDLSQFLLCEAPDEDKQSWLQWMEAVAGHHGYVCPHYLITDADQLALPLDLTARGVVDKQARQQWMQALEALFLRPEGLTLDDEPPACSPLLAGFCSVADWLGSWTSEETFVWQPTAEPLEDYFRRRYHQDAPEVIRRSGLISHIHPWQGVAALLDTGNQPRQLQTLVDKLPVKPGLTLIEAPTGSGKTETALAYAWRLLASGQADSIIFALPTQATANAMLARLDKLATIMFSSANLILAHGNSRFSQTFNLIKSRADKVQGADGEAWAQCCEWLSRSNKRAFLGQIGVCTIDQVLLSVLPVKHQFIRGFGLGRSVLLVDEVHAYDTYMHKLLEEVLRQQYQAGQSALLLSATLPPAIKQQLLATYVHQDDSPAEQQPYPLISWQQGHQQQCFDLLAMPQHLPQPFSVATRCRYLNEMLLDEPLLAEMITAARAGAQLCLICNLVDVAQQVYQQLADVGDIEVILFHSRFTLVDRADKEARTLSCFGKAGDRSVGRILVATQVVEQSLDVDFDWLITQHCPADLLFQRIGRLHRHQRQDRPEGFHQPMVTVLLPADTHYGRSNYIYTHTRAMWLTQQQLEQIDEEGLVFPQAYRQWINRVYQTEPLPPPPDWVEKGMRDFNDKELSRRSNARQILASRGAINPFADDNQFVRAVTRDGEMSLPLIPVVETAHGRQLLDGTLLDALPELAVAEALALNRVSVPGHWQKKWGLEPGDDGVVWLTGNLQGAEWQRALTGGRLCYSRQTGMRVLPA